MQRLLDLLTELQARIPAHEKLVATVSAANVGWHIQHTSLVMVRIIDAVKQSDPATYKWKFNWKRSYVYLTNKIPRGKIKAPKAVQPQVENDVQAMQSGIDKAKARVNELSLLQSHHYFTHPFLGSMNLKRTIKFLELHTQHHLKIINEILAA